MDQIRIFSPATIANVSCGFDALGLALDALGDKMLFRKTLSKGIQISKIEGANLSFDIDKAFSDPDESWFESRTDDGIVIYTPAENLRRLYAGCPGISVDYAVMEKTRKIRMVKADFEWNDVGSWDVIAELDNPPDAAVYSYQSERNYVYSDRPVALCGVDDLIVVVANDRVMVCRKGMSQLVKNAAEEDLSAN